MYGNCTLCSRFSSLNRHKICDKCFPEDEHLLRDARQILDNEGKRTVIDLANDIFTEPERVFMWIDQKRIPTELLEYLCPKCGDDLLNGMCSCQMERFLIRTPEEEPEPVAAEESKGFHSNRRVSKKCDLYWEFKSKIRRRQKRDIWILT